MAIVVRGHDEVRNHLRALGNQPSHAAIKKAKSAMSRYVSERSKNGNQSNRELDSILTRRCDLMFKQIQQASPNLKKENAHLMRILEHRAKRRIKRPPLRKVESSIVADTVMLSPPYDDQWVSNPAHQQANADKTKGTYDLAVQSFGDGTQEVAAGLVSFFTCTVTGLQRFAAVIDFSDDWWDSAMGYVAHNYVSTRLWVWGQTENTWVVQTEVQPSWSDGVSWFQSHGNDPNGQTGEIAVETFFQGQANSVYQGWVWTDAQAYSNKGVGGFGASSIKFSASVPWMLFT